jgi:tRNA(Arg) A34 adenosine deaminase TadA
MHAELQAIRVASQVLGSPRLDGCTIYASGHPCPMCLSAMHLTGIREFAYAYSNEEGEPYNLSTAKIYAEMAKPLAAQSLKATHIPVRIEGEDPYEMWKARSAT